MPIHLDRPGASAAERQARADLCREIGNSAPLRPFAKPEVMPRVTTGNTMAPCVVIGERAADLIRKEHGL